MPAEDFHSTSRVDSHLSGSERSHDLIAAQGNLLVIQNLYIYIECRGRKLFNLVCSVFSLFTFFVKLTFEELTTNGYEN